MAVRPSMALLIARLRIAVGDVAADSVFDDEELQAYLDDRQSSSVHELLTYDTVLTGNPTTYRHDYHWWEADAVLVNGSGGVVAPDDALSDPLGAVWVITGGVAPPLYVSGRHYRFYAAARDVLEAWAAREAREFDFATDGQSFRRSQKSAGMLAVAREYARRA